jgi:urease gamma subunit
MLLKRDGSTLQNTDTEAYLIAKKRKEMQRDRQKKDELLESLSKRVIQLEAQMKEVMEMIGNIYDIS